jgi:UDP-N-acetylglucosamine 2-epimerase (non-hydrolysing)/GDP/UDP-N,N'-diacetylbacillosamine 2-epimerase (hydrolysing)
MTRRIVAITGTRAEYGSMRPVFEAIARAPELALELVVTGMHLSPRFHASLAEIVADDYCPRHVVAAFPHDDSRLAMAHALGQGLREMADVLDRIHPDAVLVQGDRGEMLAAALAAAHLDIPVVHMSGGDVSGSIDDSIRKAVTSFAHVHLTTCPESSARVMAMGEAPERVFEVGEPALDVIRTLQPVPLGRLAEDFALDADRPFILASQHPVTTEANESGAQVRATLEALTAFGMQTVFTHPNTDAGYEAIVEALAQWQPRDFLRVVPHAGSARYISLMRHAAVMVGNSSSGILEAASFGLPVVNIGTRQNGRTRACNVIDAGYESAQIAAAIARALGDPAFRAGLAGCVNPYGDGHCAERTVDILSRLRLHAGFTAKWLPRTEPILDP